MLAILTTHPIQYQVPLWRALALDGRVPFEVWYLCDHAVRATHDPEVGKSFAWELGQGSLEGYAHRFLKINKRWSLHPSEFFGIRLRESLVPLLREKGVTALWIQGWQKYAYWQAVVQAKRAGVEVWLRGETNDLAPEGPALKRWAKRARMRWLFSRVDRFLCIGTANRRFYRKHGVPESKLFSAPYCVDNARFAAQAAALRPSRVALRREWNIPENAFVVLFCGKFIPKKRPMDVVEAARLLVRETGGVEALANSEPSHQSPTPSHRGLRPHLLFVGSGELGSQLRAATNVVFDADAVSPSDSGLPDHQSPLTSHETPHRRPQASFAGFLNQTEISKAYVAADVLVLPSDHGETWGLVVNEAMASGLPCIVSDAVGCGEDLVAPVNPRAVFRFGDLKALATAIADQIAVTDRSGLRDRVIGRVEEFSFGRSVTSVAELIGCKSTAISTVASQL